ncbi:MAG: hypothetical protein ACI9MJ_001004 [Alphaproteobacteria bacterium]|jgi:hypothetical protein
MLRRDILKGGFAVACAMATGANAFPALVGPTNGSPGPAQRASMKFAGALRAIGSDACIAAAQRLEAGEGGNGDISLHLRRASLNTADAIVLARAVSALTDEEALTLGSLSLSYNPGIGDAGASIVARALPATLTELGLVGCGIGDQGGEALLRWAENASGLRMICVEDNRFSDKIKTLFVELSRAKHNLFVVV